MTTQTDVSHLSLKLDGNPVPPEVQDDLMEVSVDHSLHLPSMFTIRLHNQDMKWLESPVLREGKRIEIFCGEPPVSLMAGKIAIIEPDLDQLSPTLVIQGYDLSHKLYRGHFRRSFRQVTDADLVKKIAAEAGLKLGTVEATGEVYEYLFQNNQTNAAFLLERARRIGYECWVENETLYFRKPDTSREAIKLAWGETLRHFRPRLSTVEQVNEVEVRAWNPRHKEAVIGRASRSQATPQVGINQPGAEIARQSWGEARLALVDQHLQSPAEAELLAQAALDELASSFLEAEGSCLANPKIAPGRVVQIEGIGARFSGRYYVTKVMHEWSQSRAMLTHFNVSGRRDRDVWSLLEASTTRRVGMNVVIAIVTNNQDPEGLGRVRVKFPWLAENEESDWARLVSPAAGNGRGFMFLPEIDDEVLVAFEHGDIHRPYVIGALWNGKDKLPLETGKAVGSDGRVNRRILKSRSGHTITLDDTTGDEKITIVDKNGRVKLTFHSPNSTLILEAQGDLSIQAQGKLSLAGKAGVELGSSEAGCAINGKTGLELKSADGITLSAAGSASFDTQAGLDLKGKEIRVGDGAGEVNVKGTNINIGDGAGEVGVKGTDIKVGDGAGELSMKGTSISVGDGAGVVSVTGSVIKLNS